MRARIQPKRDRDRVRVCVLKHVEFEGPGIIAEWARARMLTLDQRLVPVDGLPNLRGVDFLIVLGGPMSAADVSAHPWLAAEKALLVQAVADDGPLVLGVCLGAQLVAEALGGTVRRNAEPEIGWFPVRRTEDGRASRAFRAWPDEFVAGHWHGDTFDLPAGIVSAAESDACANQAFEAHGGRVVGVQCHLEWALPDLEHLVDACASELVPGRYVQTAEDMLGHPEHLDRIRAPLFDLLESMAAEAAR